ncbi:MAG: type I 3-dehydroquinate dehydratase [Lachnospiraceae bacterium]|nr:type I 3-dehydroquinate dehydratase [Lachnospiraceae bacterium]
MHPVKVRNITIGEGSPKICVPIVGVTAEEIKKAAEEILKIGADVIEWRADWYEDVFDFDKVEETVTELRKVIGDMVLLFTFRTAKEGGEKAIDEETYVALNERVAKSGQVDLIDVEAFFGDGIVTKIIETAHAQGVKVIASNHDFRQTPPEEELIKRMQKMQDLGADIPKIAVMPQTKSDILTLLSATEKMAGKYAKGPIITMSMGGPGVISRLCGEIFGSALTFGAVGKTSAPGQMEVKDLKIVLELLHKSIS